MNKIKMTLLAVSLISFFTTFTSCNGQISSKTKEEKTNAIGVNVTQLDTTIWAIYQDNNSLTERYLKSNFEK